MSINEKKVTVIVPVYGDWPSLRECIESLKKYLDSRHSVLLVNDCGPEADKIETNIKKAIKSKDYFYYKRNKKNLGFVKNCNNAVKHDETSNDVLLLNSDTEVTEGFLESMLAALYDDPKNGVVSPRSNNATICTVPLSAAPQKGINPQESHGLFMKHKSQADEYSTAPTAHGFCMLIRRDLINKYGLFDEVFGKGYGEEVDFCQRIRAKGYKTLISNRAYVFHKEARSFTPEKKSEMLAKNNEIIWKRWPNYRQEVRDYMKVAVPKEDELLGLGQNKAGFIKRVINKLKSFL